MTNKNNKPIYGAPYIGDIKEIDKFVEFLESCGFIRINNIVPILKKDNYIIRGATSTSISCFEVMPIANILNNEIEENSKSLGDLHETGIEKLIELMKNCGFTEVSPFHRILKKENYIIKINSPCSITYLEGE